MANKGWTKSYYKDKHRYGAHAVYHQVSRSTNYPESSTKQDSKRYAEFNSCGRKTLGRVK